MDKFNLPKGLLDAVSNVVGGSRKQQAEQSSQFKQAMEQKYKPTTLRPLPAESLAEQPKRENKDAALHSSIREIFVKSATAAQQEQQSAVGRINSMYARTGAARPVAEAKAHTVPKTEKEKDLAALAKPKDKITHKDVMVGRGVVKEEDTEQVEEGWDDMLKAVKDRKAAEGTGKFDSKKTSTGTVYTRKSETFDDGGKDADMKKAEKKLKKEEIEQVTELKKATVKSYLAKKMASLPGKDPKKDQKSLMAAHHRVTGVKPTSEEKDTPGNGYEHQCAIHVKHAKLGEGKTLFSQHAEPAEDGTIAWYDIMFEHGIEKQVPTTDLEIVVSESHMNHKKKKM